MAKRKYLQLVEYKSNMYAVHEALIDLGSSREPYWVGSEPLETFDNYQEAMSYWCKYEKLSGVLDIRSFSEVYSLFDRTDYSVSISELDFNT